jgi:glycosyltransferase involved in cell wall biosynthesis
VVSFALRESLRTAGEAMLAVPCDDLDAFAAAIESLCLQEEQRAELSRRALERVSHITWDRSADALLAAYASLGGASNRVPMPVDA